SLSLLLSLFLSLSRTPTDTLLSHSLSLSLSLSLPLCVFLSLSLTYTDTRLSPSLFFSLFLSLSPTSAVYPLYETFAAPHGAQPFGGPRYIKVKWEPSDGLCDVGMALLQYLPLPVFCRV